MGVNGCCGPSQTPSTLASARSTQAGGDEAKKIAQQTMQSAKQAGVSLSQLIPAMLEGVNNGQQTRSLGVA
jgi:hypothetical protein